MKWTSDLLYERLKSVTLGGGICVYTPEICEMLLPKIEYIEHLKKEQNVCLLAHSYVVPEIIRTVADEVGDSYYLSKKAKFVKITKAGFIFGGSYGEGVLKIGGAPVDFYSVASASYGYQIGALQYSHVIFFMTEDALKTFRITDGWEIGADAEVFFRKKGGSLGFGTKAVPLYCAHDMTCH